MEKIIENKLCKQCNSGFKITNKDLEFYSKISPVINGKKYKINSPTLCPDCRQQRRLIWRNERNLYKRKCDITKKDIISVFSPDKKCIVYNQDYWWSDKWDAMDYGFDFNFKKGFFEQLTELSKKVPNYSILNSKTTNSEYCNYIYGAKNCYLSYVVYYDAEDLIYCTFCDSGKGNIDCLMTHFSENCYECVDCTKCYLCFNSTNLYSSNNCYFSRDLDGCSYCIGCSNLKNKSYYIFNKKVSKEEFNLAKKNVFNEKSKKTSLRFIKSQFFRSENNVNCDSCTGNYLTECKDCYECYDSQRSENSKYLLSPDTNNSYDGIGGYNEFCYEYSRVGRAKKTIFSHDIVESYNISYSICIYYSNNLFGCIGLKNKEYCIFNKQYTKEEYNKLVPKIIKHMKKIGEWGEFFPYNISQFGYNETVAQEYFPLKKEEAIKLGFNWSDYEAPFPKVEKIIQANKLPKNITDIPDDILNWAVECEITKKPFKIIKEELEFYRKHNLPIPKKHPDQRHLDRMALRNPRKLFNRKCDKCSINMKTTYSQDREEIVYCEKCYNKEVY